MGMVENIRNYLNSKPLAHRKWHASGVGLFINNIRSVQKRRYERRFKHKRIHGELQRIMYNATNRKSMAYLLL